MKKPPEEIRRVGIVANTGKTAAIGAVRLAAKLVTRSGRSVICDVPTAEMAGLRVPSVPGVAALARQADVILVFGGDGTMLRVAREMNGARTLLLGINVGGLGFLTDVSSDALEGALGQLWRGDYTCDSRPLIEATGQLGDRRLRALAMNDFVVSRGTVSRLIEIEVRVDDEVLTTYRCDGLILSSPTGSTAYSLSAGGAVISPGAEVFALTPICPHTLSNRSVIVPLNSRIDIKVVSERPDTTLSADGIHEAQLNAGDVIRVSRSRNSVRLVHLTGTSFFQTLRHKLHWRGSPIPPR